MEAFPINRMRGQQAICKIVSTLNAWNRLWTACKLISDQDEKLEGEMDDELHDELDSGYANQAKRWAEYVLFIDSPKHTT